MIFVVCKYSNWCKFWFKELVSYYRNFSERDIAANDRKTSIKIDGAEIRLIPNSRLETMTAGMHHTQIIFWNGQNVKDLAAKIEKIAGE